MTNTDKSSLEVIKEQVDSLDENQEMILVYQTSETPDEQGNVSYMFAGNMNPNSLTTIASILLTQFGQEMINQNEEDVSHLSQQHIEAKAFFMGLSAISKIANRWIDDMKADGTDSEVVGERHTGGKHVSDFVTDSGSANDGGSNRAH